MSQLPVLTMCRCELGFENMTKTIYEVMDIANRLPFIQEQGCKHYGVAPTVYAESRINHRRTSSCIGFRCLTPYDLLGGLEIKAFCLPSPVTRKKNVATHILHDSRRLRRRPGDAGRGGSDDAGMSGRYIKRQRCAAYSGKRMRELFKRIMKTLPGRHFKRQRQRRV